MDRSWSIDTRKRINTTIKVENIRFVKYVKRGAQRRISQKCFHKSI